MASTWLAMPEHISTMGLRRGIMDSRGLPFTILSWSIIATRCAGLAAFSGSTGRKRRADHYSASDQACADRFEGEHDGYKRFGVRHRRTVQWLAGAGWLIIDDIDGFGVHDVRLHWLMADLPYVVSDSPFQVVFTAGQSRVRCSILASSPGNGAIIRAGARVEGNSAGADTRVLGWESPTYGDIRPAVSLVYETRSQLPLRFVTAVLTDERCKLKSKDGQFIILNSESRDEPEVYRVNFSANRDAHRRNAAVRGERAESMKTSLSGCPQRRNLRVGSSCPEVAGRMCAGSHRGFSRLRGHGAGFFRIRQQELAAESENAA